jgi:hypothetical protein
MLISLEKQHKAVMNESGLLQRKRNQNKTLGQAGMSALIYATDSFTTFVVIRGPADWRFFQDEKIIKTISAFIRA